MSRLLACVKSLHTTSWAYAVASKSQIEPLLVSVHSLISSSRPNESISEELAEMIGFDEIELVMDMLNERTQLSQDVSGHSSSWASCDTNL